MYRHNMYNPHITQALESCMFRCQTIKIIIDTAREVWGTYLTYCGGTPSEWDTKLRGALVCKYIYIYFRVRDTYHFTIGDVLISTGNES